MDRKPKDVHQCFSDVESNLGNLDKEYEPQCLLHFVVYLDCNLANHTTKNILAIKWLCTNDCKHITTYVIHKILIFQYSNFKLKKCQK